MIGKMASWRSENRARIAARSDKFVEVMKEIDGWDVIGCGSYFGYVKHPYRGKNSQEVAKKMAEEAGVLVIPGVYVCISVANIFLVIVPSRIA